MFQSNEIFNGSIPPVCMMQILKAVDFSSWKECVVGCSGTFTFERAIHSRWPDLPMHGNDVSLMSSGITDTDLGILDDPDFDRLRIGPPKYEEVVLAFLPEDREEFQIELDALTKRTKAKRVYLTRFAEYEAFFETMMRTKDVRDVTNDAVTLSVMVQLAKERLDQIEAESETDAA